MPNAKYGDADPLDICVLSERPIAKSEIIINARVIGGLSILDGGEADDKIIGVM
jgi:inorganic pyrophosphatase